MKFALDTNVLAYAAATIGAQNRLESVRLLRALEISDTILPVQILGELFHVLARKRRMPIAEARPIISRFAAVYEVVPTTENVLARAMDIAGRYLLSPWDAVILAAAAERGCGVLLTEDMQHGATLDGVTIVNPFDKSAHPVLERLGLAGSAE